MSCCPLSATDKRGIQLFQVSIYSMTYPHSCPVQNEKNNSLQPVLLV
uniref:Uncharacterized protein MANES_03G080300 n=1 Tax=Rhizophora mucronata TaxID=61149 RepID=A0A2P2IJV4_RHIMU